MNRLCLVSAAVLLAWSVTAGAAADLVEHTEKHPVRVKVLTRGLHHPWSLAFLPGGRMLVTERRVRLHDVAADGTLDRTPIAGLPKAITEAGQGGLHDVVPHPEFPHIGWRHRTPRTHRVTMRGRRRGRVRSSHTLFTRWYAGPGDRDGHGVVTLPGQSGRTYTAQRWSTRPERLPGTAAADRSVPDAPRPSH